MHLRRNLILIALGLIVAAVAAPTFAARKATNSGPNPATTSSKLKPAATGTPVIIDDGGGGGGGGSSTTYTKTIDYAIPDWGTSGTHVFTITRDASGVLSVTVADGLGNVERTLSATDLAQARAGSGPTLTNPGYPVFTDPTLTTQMTRLPRLAGPMHMQVVRPGAPQSSVTMTGSDFSVTLRGIEGSEAVVTGTIH